MAEPWLSFPVKCPECRRKEILTLPVASVAAALLKGSLIELYASCHDIYWDAGPGEVEHIRECLGGLAGVSVQRVSPPTSIAAIPIDVGALVNTSSQEGKEARTD
jgi:hypothetical protein